jgi:Zn-dependent M32 family carboxypeptidase
VHGLGAKVTVNELMKEATGKALSAASFVRYVESKYLEGTPQTTVVPASSAAA